MKTLTEEQLRELLREAYNAGYEEAQENIMQWSPDPGRRDDVVAELVGKT